MKNKEITFKTLHFSTESGVSLESFFGYQYNFEDNAPLKRNIVEVQLAGGNKRMGCGKQGLSSEGDTLKYVAHSMDETSLVIVQQNDKIEVRSHFVSYGNENVIRCFTEVKNISMDETVLEYVSAANIFGIGGTADTGNIDLYRFTNSWHVECQPRKFSLFDLGLFKGNHRSNKRVSGYNIGSWSSKEELPQAIIENKTGSYFLMFQIESNNSWYWEIGEDFNSLYLNLSGPNQTYNQWSKKLKPGESYRTVNAAVAFAESLDGVIDEMTKYRRHIVRQCLPDKNLPTIFNEYMHLSWDSPYEARTAELAPVIAALGVEYYVIDCGWHNEEPGNEIYPYVGQWRESKARFPKGIKYTIDLIHSCGMKAGLWLEPEIIGYLCRDMLDFYPPDAYFYRNGKPIVAMGRKFLDFRSPAVIGYLNGVIDKLLGDYGVDYLKFDYNEDCGPGTELNSDSLGEGLEQHSAAYFAWVESIMQKYPDVMIETCSSGGQRMDYKTLSQFPIVSTSDQTDYKKYPYIAGNILSAVLPEQAAVWSYPVESLGGIGSQYNPDYREINARVTSETVIMNMINSFLGRMHLASHIEMLAPDKQALIKEGIEYYNSISEDKKKALPFFPLGFTDFSKDFVAAGFKTDDKIYLAVWNLGAKLSQQVPLPKDYISAVIVYPREMETEFILNHSILTVKFNKTYQARFFEIMKNK